MDDHGIWSLDEAANRHQFCFNLARLLPEFFDPQYPVIDLGCGLGGYAAWLAAAGYAVQAFDGTYGLDALPLTCFHPIQTLDLARPIENKLAGQVLCLEVGEHVHPEHERILFDNLAWIGRRRALISWAIPGQGGHGHWNERPNEYVIEQLETRRWVFLPEITAWLRGRDFGLCNWFEQTLLAFQAPEDRHDVWPAQ